MRGRIKHIIVSIALLFSLAALEQASAQHYVGVRAGWGGGTGGRFYPSRYAEQSTLWGLYHGGVSWKYYTRQKYVGATEVDLLFMQQGYKELNHRYSLPHFPGDSTGYYSRKVNSIVIPLMWQPHIYMFQRNMRVFLNAGVTFSYNISSKWEQGSKENGVIDGGKYPMLLVRDNRFGYGLVAGGGMGYSVGRIEVVAEVRYYIGYSDIRKNWNKYYDDGDGSISINKDSRMNQLRSPLDGLQASVGIYYRFGKKGILSPPSPRVEQKMREKQQARYLKKYGPPPGDEDGEGLPPDEQEEPGDVMFTAPLTVEPVPGEEPQDESTEKVGEGTGEN